MGINEPAFPGEREVLSGTDGIVTEHMPGLTKREYFAGLAMQGLLASPADIRFNSKEAAIDTMTKRSVEFADALLDALAKERT